MTRPHRITVAILCTLVLLVLPGWAMRHERADHVEERRAALEEVQQRNAELRQVNADLVDDLTTLSDGNAGLEHEVRERLGWLLPNETAVVFAAPEAE